MTQENSDHFKIFQITKVINKAYSALQVLARALGPKERPQGHCDTLCSRDRGRLQTEPQGLFYQPTSTGRDLNDKADQTHTCMEEATGLRDKRTGSQPWQDSRTLTPSTGRKWGVGAAHGTQWSGVNLWTAPVTNCVSIKQGTIHLVPGLLCL